jgi:5-hydroxyisourate hydrolase-like protein (transthyretin family)
MSAITTHVLDTSLGRPGAGIRVELYRKCKDAWKLVGQGRTDATGRCGDLMGDEKPEPGTYRFVFHVAEYFR